MGKLDLQIGKIKKCYVCGVESENLYGVKIVDLYRLSFNHLAHGPVTVFTICEYCLHLQLQKIKDISGETLCRK